MQTLDRFFQQVTKPMVFGLMALLAVISYSYLDLPIAAWFHGMDSRYYYHWLFYLTAVGKWTAWTAVFGILTIHFTWLRPNALWRNRLILLLMAVLIPNMFCLILKVILGRARPELFFDYNLYGFFWFKFKKLYWSFPSGHTTTITALVLALIALWPRRWPIFLVIGLLVIATRVILYEHYFSDVIATLYLTILIMSGVIPGWRLLTKA